jgi:DNA-binding NarL/FixJ family response regulator
MMGTIGLLAPAWKPHLAPGSYARAINARRLLDRLTERQQQVLSCMAAGLLNKQIAWRLTIAEKTVKMHRALLIAALEVRSSAEAVRIFTEASFVERLPSLHQPAARDEQHH